MTDAPNVYRLHRAVEAPKDYPEREFVMPSDYRPEVFDNLARYSSAEPKPRRYTLSDRITDYLGMKVSHFAVCAMVVGLIVMWLCGGRS